MTVPVCWTIFWTTTCQPFWLLLVRCIPFAALA